MRGRSTAGTASRNSAPRRAAAVAAATGSATACGQWEGSVAAAGVIALLWIRCKRGRGAAALRHGCPCRHAAHLPASAAWPRAPRPPRPPIRPAPPPPAPAPLRSGRAEAPLSTLPPARPRPSREHGQRGQPPPPAAAACRWLLPPAILLRCHKPPSNLPMRFHSLDERRGVAREREERGGSGVRGLGGRGAIGALQGVVARFGILQVDARQASPLSTQHMDCPVGKPFLLVNGPREHTKPSHSSTALAPNAKAPNSPLALSRQRGRCLRRYQDGFGPHLQADPHVSDRAGSGGAQERRGEPWAPSHMARFAALVSVQRRPSLLLLRRYGNLTR